MAKVTMVKILNDELEKDGQREFDNPITDGRFGRIYRNNLLQL